MTYEEECEVRKRMTWEEERELRKRLMEIYDIGFELGMSYRAGQPFYSHESLERDHPDLFERHRKIRDQFVKDWSALKPEGAA